ncbi:MAG: ExbD/TolR family protein [Opitutales bacterium]
MLTRPLDLASRLRPEPRRYDALFWVNGALIGLFFVLFGSRFVLAPGLAVDFTLPELRGANAGAARTTHVISVARPGLIFTDDGALNMGQLRGWLADQGKRLKAPTLLVRANASIPVIDLADIVSAAQSAGFKVQIAALEPSSLEPKAEVQP